MSKFNAAVPTTDYAAITVDQSQPFAVASIAASRSAVVRGLGGSGAPVPRTATPAAEDSLAPLEAAFAAGNKGVAERAWFAGRALQSLVSALCAAVLGGLLAAGVDLKPSSAVGARLFRYDHEHIIEQNGEGR